MRIHALWLSRLFLIVALCIILVPHILSKPPDLPLPVHDDLTPGEEQPIEQVAQLDICYLPLVEPIAPLPAKAGEEEQESTPRKSAKCPRLFDLSALEAIVSGPFCPWSFDFEEGPAPVRQQVFGCYDVSDLMGETVGNNVRTGPSETKLARELMRHIEDTVRPGTWKSQGGKASMEYNPDTNSLTVRHDEEAQQDVEEVLAKLRQVQSFGRGMQAWLLGGIKLAGAEEASSERPAGELSPDLVTMGHDLSDIMQGGDADEVVRELTRLIETTIAPESWHARGGWGRLDYNPALKTFFIVQTPEVQEAIRELLNLKRYERSRDNGGFPWDRDNPGILRTGALLEKAHGELLQGRVLAAQKLVQEAVQLDRKAARRHKLLYRIQLLAQQAGEDQAVERIGVDFSTTPPKSSGVILVAGDVVDQLERYLWKAKAAYILRFEGHESCRDFDRPHPNDVNEFLVACHVALLGGRQSEAESLLRQALAKDREAVLAHPLVYKMQLLHQVLSEPEAIRPHMPAVDPGVIRAYHEILEQAPKKISEETQPTLEVQEEACELELVPEKPAVKPSVCIDTNNGRVRVQVQFAGWTFKLVDNGPGKSSFSLGWSFIGPTEQE